MTMRCFSLFAISLIFMCAGNSVRGDDKRRQSIADAFTATVDPWGFGLPIDAQPSITITPQPSKSKTHAVATFRIGRGSDRIDYFIRSPAFQVGSLVPLHGKLFEVTSVSERIATSGRPASVIHFKALIGSDLQSELSPRGDTYFLPLDGSVDIRDFHFDVQIAEKERTTAYPAVSVVFNRKRDPKTGLELEPAREFVLSSGETIRYGKYGLRIRKIVPPDESKGIGGWVEVFDKELTFNE